MQQNVTTLQTVRNIIGTARARVCVCECTLKDAIYMLILMTLTLMQGHSESASAKQINVACSRQLYKQAISIKLATTEALFFFSFYMTLTWQTFIRLDLFCFLNKRLSKPTHDKHNHSSKVRKQPPPTSRGKKKKKIPPTNGSSWPG